MVSRFLVEARLGPFSLPRVIATRPTVRKIRRGNAVWEGWRLATEPTIEPDAYHPTPCAPGSPPNYSIGPFSAPPGVAPPAAAPRRRRGRGSEGTAPRWHRRTGNPTHCIGRRT